jgi:hypothetical protein
MISNFIIKKKCKLAKGFLPSFTPEIYSLSVYTSLSSAYSNVLIDGKNFLPNGTTYVNFGNFTNIPVSYFSSFSISFVVPANASIGSYNVVVVNNYNSNYSANINTIYNQNLNFSNSVTYTLT